MTRKGHRRRADIPAALLRRLEAGSEETVTLVEWLAIDMGKLVRAAARDVGLEPEPLGAVVDAKRKEGVSARMRGVGALLFGAMRGRKRVFEALAAHRSDMVRAWAAYAVAADPAPALEERLAVARRFAADPHMAVRECAWDSFRPHLARDLARGLRLLRPWVRDADPNVRRCAVEATRPRGVWTAHLQPLREDPSRGLPLLEPVRSDGSRYVQRAVGNWLNDAAKTRPGWVREVCRRWTRESKTKETAWIVRRGLRSLA